MEVSHDYRREPIMDKRVALFLRVNTDGQTVENQRRELCACGEPDHAGASGLVVKIRRLIPSRCQCFRGVGLGLAGLKC